MLNDMLKTLRVLFKWVGIVKLKKRGETHKSVLKELKKLFAMNRVVQLTQPGHLGSNEKICISVKPYTQVQTCQKDQKHLQWNINSLFLGVGMRCDSFSVAYLYILRLSTTDIYFFYAKENKFA